MSISADFEPVIHRRQGILWQYGEQFPEKNIKVKLVYDKLHVGGNSYIYCLRSDRMVSARQSLSASRRTPWCHSRKEQRFSTVPPFWQTTVASDIKAGRLTVDTVFYFVLVLRLEQRHCYLLILPVQNCFVALSLIFRKDRSYSREAGRGVLIAISKWIIPPVIPVGTDLEILCFRQELLKSSLLIGACCRPPPPLDAYFVSRLCECVESVTCRFLQGCDVVSGGDFNYPGIL